MGCAIEFLREGGSTALVSLGCGANLNRIDNHLRLLFGLELSHYVAIDIEPVIIAHVGALFTDDEAMFPLLHSRYDGNAHRFLDTLKLFPRTGVEQLFGIHASVVICQRILPFMHWEEVIHSMTPNLILQEDLHGCELQELRSPLYRKCRTTIRHYGLKPFRPWRIFPGELNMNLWRHRDFEISPAEAKCNGSGVARMVRRVKGWFGNRHAGPTSE